MRLAGLLLLLSCACSSQVKAPCTALSAVPGFPEASYDTTQCLGPWPAFDVGLAMHVFLGSWEATFGPNNAVDYAIRHLHVTCRQEDWISEYWGYPVSGITTSVDVQVALQSEEYDMCRSVPASALVHEMVHRSLEACCGNGDADHAEGTAYGDTWTDDHDLFVEDTNLLLRELLDVNDGNRNFKPTSEDYCYPSCME